MDGRILNAGSRIGRWRVVRPLGMGQSGEVYEVEGEERRAAAKIMRGGQVTVTREEFLREIDTTRNQPASGYMPQFFEAEEREERPFFAMELTEELPAVKTVREFIELAIGMIEAVACLHRNGYTHNDIKASNFGVIGKRVVLRDFGSALPFRRGNEGDIRSGTDGYMAPEVDRDGRFSPAADYHALGRTMQEVCPPGLRRMFEPVFERATAAKPDDRTATPEALEAQLRECVTDYHREMSVASRLPKFKAVTKWSLLALALLVLGVILLTLTNRLYRRTRMTNEEMALAHAEAEAEAGKKYFHEQKNYKMAVKHLERSLRTPGFADEEVLRLLSRCYAKGLGIAKDPKKSQFFLRQTNSSYDKRCITANQETSQSLP